MKHLKSIIAKQHKRTFNRLRLHWIVQPNVADRETYVCAKHANFQFVLTKLHHMKMIVINKAQRVCSALCCDMRNKDCMYRLCAECRDKVITEPTKDDQDVPVTYFRWDKKTESRVVKGKSKEITFIHKAVMTTTKHGLVQEFELLLRPFTQQPG